MAKIRTVKPELFRHEELFEAELKYGLPLRLIFIGLFTVADREGRFRWKPRQLKLDVAPYDEIDFAKALDALLESGFICRYFHEGQWYGYIPTWHKHQHVNKRESESRLPSPESCEIEKDFIAKISTINQFTAKYDLSHNHSWDKLNSSSPFNNKTQSTSSCDIKVEEIKLPLSNDSASLESELSTIDCRDSNHHSTPETLATEISSEKIAPINISSPQLASLFDIDEKTITSPPLTPPISELKSDMVSISQLMQRLNPIENKKAGLNPIDHKENRPPASKANLENNSSNLSSPDSAQTSILTNEKINSRPISTSQASPWQMLKKSIKPDQTEIVFEHWKKTMDYPRAVLDQGRRRIINSAFTMGFESDELCAAISGCASTPFNMGKNERGERFDSLYVILKSSDQIERFIRNAKNPPHSFNKAEERLRNNIHAAEEWLKSKIAGEV